MKRMLQSVVIVFVAVNRIPLTQPASATQTAPAQAAVVLLTDVSSSMDGEPLKRAIAAGSLFIAGTDASFELGLATFDSKVRVISKQLSRATPTRRRALLGALSKIRARGGTDILGGLSAAAELLQKTRAPTKWILLLSDGRQTVNLPRVLPGERAVAHRMMQQNKATYRPIGEQLRQDGIRVLAIGLGRNVDRHLLESVASSTDGLFLRVDDPSKLLPAYVKWLRIVGAYHVASHRHAALVSASDTHLKILMSLPAAQFRGLTRNGTSVDLAAAGFESWFSADRQLAVLQMARPSPGVYRAMLDRISRDGSQIFFLKHAAAKWSVRIDWDTQDLLKPVRIEAKPDSPGAKPLKATVTISDTRSGHPPILELPLQTGANGLLAGEVFLNKAIQVQNPGTYNVDVSILDSQSQWESRHSQTVRFVPGPPRVVAEIRASKVGRVVGRGGCTELDLGRLVPGKRLPFELLVRSTPSAKGRVLVTTVESETKGLQVVSSKEIKLTSGIQKVPFSAGIPAALDKDSIATLRLAFKKVRNEGATINGSLHPAEFRIRARANIVNLQVAIRKPRSLPKIYCGREARIKWQLQLENGPAPEAELRAIVNWSEPEGNPAPEISLFGRERSIRSHSMPFSASSTIPILVRVPRDVSPNIYRTTVSLRVHGRDARYTLNGHEMLTLPVVFRTELAPVHVEFLDQNGEPVPNNAYHYTLLSPVVSRRVVLRFRMIGNGASEEFNFGPDRLTVDNVHATLERQAPRSAGDPNDLTVVLDVPAQARPGTRAFEFEITPGPGVRLQPGSERFRVDLEIPEPILVLTTDDLPSGSEFQLGLIDWIGQKLFRRRPSWSGSIIVQAKCSGLAKNAGYHLADAVCDLGERPAAFAESTVADDGAKSWKAFLGPLSVPATGDYSVFATVKSDYRHLKVVDINGNETSLSPAGGNILVGRLRVRPPSPVPGAALLAIVACAVAGYRSYHRRVPGRFLIRPSMHGLNTDHLQFVTLGKRRHRITLHQRMFELKRRWRTVWIRWVNGEQGEPVCLRCPAGHDRFLRLNGNWEQLCGNDCLVVGPVEAEYLARVGRHCPLSSPGCSSAISISEMPEAEAAGAVLPTPAGVTNESLLA